MKYKERLVIRITDLMGIAKWSGKFIAKKARRRRIHIEISLVSLNEEIIPHSRYANLVRNMGRIYDAVPEAEGDMYHIRAWDAGGPFKILGTMSDIFDHFAKQYPELIRELVDLKSAANISETHDNNAEVAFCARIMSPSLTTDVPLIKILNVLFAKLNAGLYFEVFPGGLAMYAENSKAFAVFEQVFDPDYVRWKEENRSLMDSDPALFFQKLKEYLGL